MEVEPGAPKEGRLQHMRESLREAMAGSTVAEVARRAGISRTALREALRSGEADMFVIAKLEAYFETDLWSVRHPGEAKVRTTSALTEPDQSADS